MYRFIGIDIMGFFTNIYGLIKRVIFWFNGKKPYARGYTAYRQREICKVLDGLHFDAKKLAPGYGLRLDERIVEYPWLFSRLPDAQGKLLDAGSILNHDFILAQKKLKAKKIFISTLAPESSASWRKGISYIYDDLRDACFRDNYFDWIVSLSTLEHVGLDNTLFYTDEDAMKEDNQDSYLTAVKEFYRMLKPRGVLYLSVPFGTHKNHGWLQVFDGRMIDNIKEAFGPVSCVENYFRYDVDGWQVSSREKSEDATYFDYHKSKEYDADNAVAARAVACLELVK